jgi:hypothetical protein
MAGKVSKEEALLNADSRTNMEWLLGNTSKYQEKKAQRQQKILVEDKVSSEEDDGVPSLLSMEDLSKIGIGKI